METPAPPLPPVPPAPPPVPKRRSMRWLLIASLTINFLVLGVVVGAAYKFRGGGPHAMELSLGPFARALDDGDRRAIMRDLMQNDAARPPSRREREAILVELVTALKAEPFNLDPVRVLIDRQKEWVMSAQTAAQDAVLARIEAMSQEERTAFAERLGREIGHGPDGEGP